LNYVVRCSQCKNGSIVDICEGDEVCPICSAGNEKLFIVAELGKAMPSVDVIAEGMNLNLGKKGG
jgi:uncharacterized protein (UPF0212 family)